MYQLIKFWPYIVAYFAIGILFMCVVNYIKGRKRELSTISEIELDLVGTLGFFVWPVMIVIFIAIGVAIVGSKPFAALSSFCEKLGRRHRSKNA